MKRSKSVLRKARDERAGDPDRGQLVEPRHPQVAFFIIPLAVSAKTLAMARPTFHPPFPGALGWDIAASMTALGRA
jgi:hypothetical protein